MKRVVLPRRNEHDLKDVPEEALRDLEVVLVDRIDELLPHTLMPVDEVPAKMPIPEGKPATTGTEVRVEGGEARA